MPCWMSSLRRSGALVVGAFLPFGSKAHAEMSYEPPVQLTAEQDHQRLLDLLHIHELRRGPDGDPKSPRAANFDESKVQPYKLPDPLLMRNGQRVKSSEAWWKQRRP